MHLVLISEALPAAASTSVTTDEIVGVIVAVLLPLLVGLVTKASWGGEVRAILLAVLSAVSGVAQGFLDRPPGVAWDWQHAVLTAVTTFVIAVAMHYGLWDKIGASEAAKRTLIKDTPPGDHEALPDAA